MKKYWVLVFLNFLVNLCGVGQANYMLIDQLDTVYFESESGPNILMKFSMVRPQQMSCYLESRQKARIRSTMLSMTKLWHLLLKVAEHPYLAYSGNSVLVTIALPDWWSKWSKMA